MQAIFMPTDPSGRELLARAAFVLLAFLGVVSPCGCSSPPLAGTNDVALEYVIDDGAAGAAWRDTRLFVAAVKARLAAASVIADVLPWHAGALRILIDADAAAAADELLLWRGGLSVYRVDDSYAFPATDAPDVRPVAPADVGAGRDAGWTGPPASIARFVRQARLDAKHTAFAERLDPNRSRTRVVATPAIVGSFGGGTEIEAVTAAEHGRALAVDFPPLVRARLGAERDEEPRMRVALVRGHTLVATVPIGEALAARWVVVPFGDDVTAYARAYRAERLLRSPTLPPMHRVSATRLPARWGLAAACALLPFALSFAWLLFVRRFDRARPEPTWLVLATFVLGGVAIVPAALAEAGLASMSPWLDPSVVTLGGRLWALPLSLGVLTLVTGAVEEGCKWLAAWGLASHRPEFDEPVDGIVYACASALGFAAVENVKYFALGRMSGAVIAVRAFMTIPAHMFFAALWGYAMGRRLVSSKTSVFGFFALASLAHGAYDAALSTEGTPLVSTLLVVLLGVAFVTLLRRALRYGAVPREATREVGEDTAHPASLPPSAFRRVYFRVGAVGAFYASAAVMLGSAFALTLLGSACEFLPPASGGGFVGAACGFLSLFGASAYAVSETIPLNVALDEQGVTYAGSRNAWTQIVGVGVEGKRRRAFVRIRLRESAVRLGPVPLATAHRIADAMAAGRRGPA